MRLLTIASVFLTLILFSSCEQTLEENLVNEPIESAEKMFFFAPQAKDGQLEKGYKFEGSLEQINIKGSFAISWGDSDEYYSLDFNPAESQVTFLKHFDGKDCLETADVNLIKRSSSLKFDVMEDNTGKLNVSVGGDLLFENTAESFAPSYGKYNADGGLVVAKFKLY